jgi:hypothetical protein
LRRYVCEKFEDELTLLAQKGDVSGVLPAAEIAERFEVFAATPQAALRPRQTRAANNQRRDRSRCDFFCVRTVLFQTFHVFIVIQ